VNTAEHRIAIASKTVTRQYGSYTVLQQVNVQSDHQCKWIDSRGRVVHDWDGVRGNRGCKNTTVYSHFVHFRPTQDIWLFLCIDAAVVKLK